MRYLFVVNNYPPKQGGVEIHVANLAEELVRQGNTCIVVTVSRNREDRLQNGVRVIGVPGRFTVGKVFSFPVLGTSRRIRNLINAQNIDIVSIHTRFFPMTWIGVEAAQKTNRVSIVTEHGSDYVTGVSRAIAFASKMVDLTFGRRALRRATVRLGISESAQTFIRMLSGSDAQIFYNAIKVSTWLGNSSEVPKRLVFVGRLVNGKGWSESVRVFDSLAATDPEISLEIFGNGPELHKAEQLINNSPYSSRITLHGSQPATHVKDSLQGSIFLNPTSLSEGFQTTLLEAMAAGARIVSYPTPGLDQLIASGAPVWIATDFSELTTLTAIALDTPPRMMVADALTKWDWTYRANQYASIAKLALENS